MKSLKAKIISMLVLCTLITSFIIGFISIFNATKIASANSNEFMQLTLQNKSSEINMAISRIEQSVNTLALIAEDRLDDVKQFKNSTSYVNHYTSALKNIAEDFGKHTDGALSVYIRYNPKFTEPTSGLFLVRKDLTSSFKASKPTDFSTYKPSDIEHVGWYYLPIQNQVATWIDPYMNANINVYMISYVVPIFKDGVSIGVVGMDIDFNTIKDIVNDTHIYNSGYAFLTNKNNAIMQHKDLDFNTDLNTLSNITATLNDSTKQGKLTQYSYNNESKNMIFTKLDNGMKFVLTAPTSEIYANSNNLTLRIILFSLLAILTSLILGLLLSHKIVKPLTKLTTIIEDTSCFNFKPTVGTEKLYKLKDETGNMTRAVHSMREALRDIVGNMDHAAQTITHNMDELYTTIQVINTNCMDNSATSEELAAGMQQTAATTDTISEGIQSINQSTLDISKLSQTSHQLSNEVLERANALYNKTTSATDKTAAMYTSVKDKTALAIEKAKAVDKINELTNTITNISTQTGLLALNASIEAARAGESGKGFAVVASQISVLSDQSNEAVKGIKEIIQEIQSAFSNMSSCLLDTSDFLENVVLADYKEFMVVGKQYAEDANAFQNSTAHIYEAINTLTATTTQINESIQGINATITEASKGVMDIAEKTSAMVKTTAQTDSLASTNKESIEKLESIVKSFTLK